MVTSTVAIEQVALALFEEQGFEATTVDDIATAAGISRRTFFRYFASKNDILYANFDEILAELEAWFEAADDGRPMFDVIAEATMRFNRVHSDGAAAHRERMELILHTPALRANASLHHDEWAASISRYAAKRLAVAETDLSAQLVGHVALAVSSAAYEQWLSDPSADLADVIARAFAMSQSLSDLEREP